MFDYVAHTGSGTNGGKPKTETGGKLFKLTRAYLIVFVDNYTCAQEGNIYSEYRNGINTCKF